MKTQRSRTTALWMADHALLIVGTALLIGSLTWSFWLMPWGWTALGLGLVAWITESNGYAIPRLGRAPIVSAGCGEVPLAFGVSRAGRHYLFARENERLSDPWPEEYSVYELPWVSKWQVCNGLAMPPAGAQRFQGRVPATELRFEHHEHSYVDSASLGRALRRAGPRAT